MRGRKAFEVFAKYTSRLSGHPVAFTAAFGSLVVWAALGPVYHYSDTWQLVVNTATTIITFLMVFLIQNSQNRDNAAVQAKLGELIRAFDGARNEMIDLEDLSEDELEKCHQRYAELAKLARTRLDAWHSGESLRDAEPTKRVANPENPLVTR